MALRFRPDYSNRHFREQDRYTEMAAWQVLDDEAYLGDITRWYDRLHPHSRVWFAYDADGQWRGRFATRQRAAEAIAALAAKRVDSLSAEGVGSTE